MGRWLVIGSIALVVAVGLGAYFAGDNGWGDRDWGDRSAQVITTESGETIVIEDNRRFFPFPFLLFPLLIIGLFWFLAGRRRWDDGPWGGNPELMRAWHEREHRAMESRGGPPSDAQAS